MLGLENRILEFAWGQDPDLALESGYLPSRLWEDLSEAGQRQAIDQCTELQGLILRSDMRQRDKLAAQYHVASASFGTDSAIVRLLNHMSGPVARLSWASQSWPLGADLSGDAYRERLGQFPAYCATLLERIRSEPWSWQYASRAVLEAFIEQIDSFLEDASSGRDCLLLLPLRRARMRGQLYTSPPAKVLDDIFDSLLLLKDAARNLARSARPASPIPYADGGLKWYSDAIYWGTSLSVTPNVLERLGHTILERSNERFRQLMNSRHVMTGSSPIGGIQLFEQFQDTHARLMTGLSSIVSVQPTMRCDVVAMPQAHAVVGPPAYYGPSSKQNDRPGSLYVNTSQPVTTRRWEILPLAMHEGVPGHHLQLGLLDENEDIPLHLKLLPVNAFTEGWAVYAETLAAEMNWDVTPADEFGLIAHQRWRAARLVVEVGLHVHGWDIADAIRFVARETAQDASAVRREIVRYLAWPGQALGYAVGAEVIRNWVNSRMHAGVGRTDAHDELLGLGSLPLSALATTNEDEAGRSDLGPS